MTKIPKFVFVVLFLLPSLMSLAQSHKASIWRGFEHSWTYNHRINRIGDFVYTQGDTCISSHTSASGVGADSTLFTSYYSLVESPNVVFQQGVAQIKLYGKEKQLITKEIEVVIPVPTDFQGFDKYTTLLNGFDLQAVGRADKLQLLRLSVEDAQYAEAVKELRFRLKVAIVVNCQSFECSRFNQKTTYDLKVYYLVVAGNDEHFSPTATIWTKSYPWNKKDEFQSAPEKNVFYGKSQRYRQATLGIKSIAITLDEAHWTVKYHCNITPLNYNHENGNLDFSLDLFFKEWQQGMKQMSAKPQHSAFSSKKRGWCVLDVGIVLLQFDEAKIQHLKNAGTMYWVGFNEPSNDPRAISEKRSVFK